MSQPSKSETLAHFTELMNELLPTFEVAGDPEPTSESRQNLLRDARATRDVYMQDRTRTENQLLAAQQLVIALTRQLRLADEKLTTLEDLIGDLRTRMRKRGLSIHPPRQLCKRTTPISTKNTVPEPPSAQPGDLGNEV